MVTLVTNPITGKLITPSKNKVGYGTVHLQTVLIISSDVSYSYTRTAYIRGKLSDLEQVFKYEGQQFTGKIIHKQSFAPLYEGHKPEIHPATKAFVLTDGKMTYIDSLYTEDPNAYDYWVVPDKLPTKQVLVKEPTNKQPTKQSVGDIIWSIIFIILFIWLCIYLIQTWDSREALRELRSMYQHIVKGIKGLLMIAGAIGIFYVYTEHVKNK